MSLQEEGIRAQTPRAMSSQGEKPQEKPALSTPVPLSGSHSGEGQGTHMRVTNRGLSEWINASGQRVVSKRALQSSRVELSWEMQRNMLLIPSAWRRKKY